MAFISSVAETVGSSEAGLRLVLGQLLGYPVMMLYRKHIASQQSTVQHLYFILTGLSAAWFVNGEDLKHSIYAITTTYLILLTAGGTLTSVIISFIFNFGYLLVGYYFTESEGYDICWTMPHCVMTLRLIGLTFDLYDGARAKRLGSQALSKDQEKSALEEAPSLLEVFSHSFFIGGYFVGPQIQMKKYQQFVSPSYQDSLPSSPLAYGFKRLALGFFYMFFHVLGSSLLPADWPTSQHFHSSFLLTKLFLLAFWCRAVLAKYLSAWLMAEGICVISGLSFSGLREDGSADWRGCANVKISRLETSLKFGHVIESFNINTNNWVAVYIYKRLKFLGSRTISQVVTLIFLAVWHGFHSGYYLVFLNEFLIIKLEREFLSIWERSSKVSRWSSRPVLARLFRLAGWCWVAFLLPHCFIAFVLLTFPRYQPAYAATYYFLFVVFATWPLIRGPLKKFLLDENRKTSREVQSGQTEEKMEVPVEAPNEATAQAEKSSPTEEEKVDKKNV